MAKNDYLARKAIENKAYFEAGLHMGRQQIKEIQGAMTSALNTANGNADLKW